MQNKYIFILIFILIITCIIFVSLHYLNKPHALDDDLYYITECMNDRVCSEINNEFYIGNNKKELQNGYYDIKVLNEQEGITIVVNKLWHKKFSELLYEREYVMELCKYIYEIVLKNMNIKFTESQLNNLYNNIVESYVKAKENIPYEVKCIIDNIQAIFYTQNYELVLKMEVI